MRDVMTTMGPGFKPPPRGEDLPHDDGEPMETQRHVEQMLLLISSLKDAWKHRDDVFVGGNMFVYFSELQAKANDFRGPDVFVVMDTTNRERKSWVVWEENGRAPDVVIELLSPSTEKVDRGEKMRVYAQLMRVAELCLFDPFTGVLEGYALDPATRTYQRRGLDAQGRLFSPVTGLSLGVVPGSHAWIEAPWLRWIDTDGQVVPSGAERAEKAEAIAGETRARAEKAEADAAETRTRAEKAEADAAALRRRVDELEARGPKR